MRSLVGFIGAFLTLFICSSPAWANALSDAQQCQAFPASIQSWSPDSTLTVGDNTYITGTDNRSGKVAFGTIVNNGPYKNFCDGQVCQPDPSLLIKEPKIIIDDFGTGNINVASSDVYELPEGSYNELSISGNAKVIFTGSNYEIKKLELSGGGSAVFLNKTFLKVDTIRLTGGGTLDVLNNSAGNLTIWSENTSKDKASVYLHFAKVNAAIFSRGKVEVSEYTSVTGSITAHDVILSGSANSTYSDTVCSIEPDETPEIDICDYIPEPVQSWKGNSTLSINNSDQQIIGWSDSYVKNNLFQSSDTTGNGAADQIFSTRCNSGDANCALKVGFDSVTELGLKYDNMACDEGVCYSGGAKIAEPPAISPGFTSTKEITIDDWAEKSQCVDGGITYCTVDEDTTTNTYTITILKSMKSLNVSAWNSANFNIVFKPDEDDTKYGLKISDVTIAGQTANLTTEFVGDGRFTFGNVIITSGRISAQGKVLIFLTTKLEVTNPFISSGGSGEVSIYGPEASVAFAGAGQELHMKILANEVTFHNAAILYGAVTTNTLHLSEPNTYIIADKGMCSTPVDNHYEIEMTPDTQLALMCGDDQPSFTITTKKNGEAMALGVDAEILPSENAADFDVSIANGTGSGSYPVFLSNSAGLLELNITAKNPENIKLNKEYTLKVTLSSDSSASDSSTYLYMPFKFQAENQFVVAGKPQNVPVTVLACSGEGETTTVSNYSGSPTVKSSLVHPSNGKGTLNFKPEFTAGESKDTTEALKFDDSGEVEVTLEDKDFDCTGLENCPIEGGGTLQGVFTVYSRPWTFAICDADGSNMDGDITDDRTLAYKAAGEPFDLYIRPLLWVSGETDPKEGYEKIDVTSLCNKSMTSNFFLPDSNNSTIQLNYDLLNPSPGDKGILSGTRSLDNIDSTSMNDDTYYDFDNLAWDEVGVIRVTVDLSDKYYDMHVNLGYRNIGRFYPHHLAQIENTWTYAAGHNGFAYMNQPIYVSFTIEAQNESNQPTKNYGLFDESLQSKIGLVAVQIDKMGNETIDLSNRLDYSPDTDSGWSDNTVFGSIGFRNAQFIATASDFNFLKSFTNGSPYTTVPDGPYSESNAKFGAYVSDMKDGVDFDYDSGTEIGSDSNVGVNHGLSFNTQPDFRYGRMTLDSVSGPIGGQISVPLRVEYWDGSSFITNPDDSGSKFKTKEYCRLSELDNSDAYLTDTVDTNNQQTVSSGKSEIVRAVQITPRRESVRLFLRQGETQPDGTNCSWENGTQPWLQFNWRNLGDEDPSTVVIFGAYRGNDRIIYRGEPNLTAN